MDKKYRQTEKAKLAAKKYRHSKKGKLMYQIANRKWYQNNKEKHGQGRSRRYQENKAIIQELKINGCAICGYTKCDNALEFHHINPEDKEFRISPDSVTNKNFIVELNKCMLLCANCHRETHQEEQDAQR